MKRFLFIVSSLLIMNCIFSQNQTRLISYIPEENEIQYYMNLYERLKTIEGNQSEPKQLESMYSSFENPDDKYYLTYQRFLFESYLLYSQNPVVKQLILKYLDSNNIHTDFSEVLKRLYNSKKEKTNTTIRYNYNDKFFDENINLFNMQEVTVFNDTLGLMLFDNDWKTITIKSKDTNDNKTAFTLVCGGGTNSISIHLKK